MTFGSRTFKRSCLTFALVAGLTMAYFPAQAATSSAPAGAATLPDAAPAASPYGAAMAALPDAAAPAGWPRGAAKAVPACPVSAVQLRYAQFRALDALEGVWLSSNVDYANCRVRVEVFKGKVGDVVARLRAAGGLLPVKAGQPIPPSTAAMVVIELTAGGPTCCCEYPPPPCGWEFEQIALSPDMTGNGHGEVLAVDQKGWLFRYGFKPDGKLDRWSSIGRNWGKSAVFGPGDWNGDAKADLMSVTKDGKMYLYLGDGKGGISPGRQIGHGWSKYTVIPAGDLTGDKIPDMLAINNTTGVLLLYTGNGKGGFKPGSRQVGHGWKGMQLFAAGDLTNDGKTDILGVKPDGRLYFYAGKGAGTFMPAQQVGRGWTGMKLAAGADLDGDGKFDIVGRTKNGDLLFYRGGGKGSFAKPIWLGRGW